LQQFIITLNYGAIVIVCSCNVLSDTQILAALQNLEPSRRGSTAQAYRCLGCAPQCGRCVATVRALIAKARLDNCEANCPSCPGAAHEDGHSHVVHPPLMIAAE